MAVVVITGCSSGIGLECALAFARTGDHVYATMRDTSRGVRLRERADVENLRIVVEPLDVTDGGAIRRTVDCVLTEAGQIDVLVNNAGIGLAGTIEEMAEEDARVMFETNFWGPYRLIRAVLPHMRARATGVIVNVSSMGARAPGGPVLGIYAQTKAALSRLSETLRAELASTGVRVVAVEPGMFATEVYRSRPEIDPTSPYASIIAAVDDRIAAGIANGADPALVADAIVALANDPDPPVRVLVGDDAIARFGATTTE